MVLASCEARCRLHDCQMIRCSRVRGEHEPVAGKCGKLRAGQPLRSFGDRCSQRWIGTGVSRDDQRDCEGEADERETDGGPTPAI